MLVLYNIIINSLLIIVPKQFLLKGFRFQAFIKRFYQKV